MAHNPTPPPPAAPRGPASTYPTGRRSRACSASSTPAPYCGALGQIRRLFAASAYARRLRWKPGHFSFNTREVQCATCCGLGHIDLDAQYLPGISTTGGCLHDLITWHCGTWNARSARTLITTTGTCGRYDHCRCSRTQLFLG